MRRIQQFHHPRSLDEALQILEKAAGRAAVIAGGTEIVPHLPDPVTALVDIMRLGLDQVETTADETRIGACVTLQQLTDNIPLRHLLDGTVREAALQSASRFIRNAATVGGNLASSNPAWDLVSALLAADAMVHLQTSAGTTSVPIAAFLATREAHLAGGAVITAVTLPRMASGTRTRFEKLARCAHDAPVATAVGRVEVRDGKLASVRAVVGGVSDRPCRLLAVETALEGATASAEAVTEALRDVAGSIPAVADVRATAKYRAEMAVVLLRRALLGAIG